MTKQKIRLDHINHHDTRRMESFLNALDDELREVPFNAKNLVTPPLVSGVCKFVSTSNKMPVTITVFFCDSYYHATEVAMANELPNTSNAKWSANGSLLYLVETDDEEKLSYTLGHFAGRE